MKIHFKAFIVILLVLAAYVARTGSTGGKILSTGREYLSLLQQGDSEGAYLLLHDSLAVLVTPEFISTMSKADPDAGVSAGRMEARGFTIFLPLREGGSRTLWLRRTEDGSWRITGDSSLDNILGGATVICSGFARETVIPQLQHGSAISEFSCPVSGGDYYVEDGRLLCSSGHLGDGLELSGTGCESLRDSLACVVEAYVSKGYEYPASFAEMYSQSGGAYGQRGGFHCPDDGYSYYSITEEGVFCPFHGLTSPVNRTDSMTDGNSND